MTTLRYSLQQDGSIADVTDTERERNEQHALRLWAQGLEPMLSTGICGDLTCGYGKLDWAGYWQYPLLPAEEYLELNRLRKET